MWLVVELKVKPGPGCLLTAVLALPGYVDVTASGLKWRHYHLHPPLWLKRSYGDISTLSPYHTTLNLLLGLGCHMAFEN